VPEHGHGNGQGQAHGRGQGGMDTNVDVMMTMIITRVSSSQKIISLNIKQDETDNQFIGISPVSTK
jgi:hypothetical protein